MGHSNYQLVAKKKKKKGSQTKLPHFRSLVKPEQHILKKINGTITKTTKCTYNYTNKNNKKLLG